jgi:hypothetical protein
MKQGWIVFGIALMAAGCAAAGIGGNDPAPQDALALRVPESMTAEALGARIKQGGYEFAMLSTSRDSAFLAAAATQAGLQMTRPGRIAGSTYAFFGPKPLGDTTHTVMVQSGGQVRLHDALYKIDKTRNLDLLIARFEGVTDLRSGVRALLSYVGSDVSNNAGLLLGVEAPTPQFGDSVALLLRAVYRDTRECASTGASASSPSIRLFFGPEARVRCGRAEVLGEANAPVSAQFVLP